MNELRVISAAAVALGLHSAYIWYRLSAAPGWHHQRWFGHAAVAAAAYALCGIAMGSPWLPVSLPAAAGIQLFLAVLAVWCWARYADGFTGHVPGPREGAWRRAYLALGLAGLAFPDLLFRDVGSTPIGSAFLAVALLGFLPIAVRLVGAWRRGVPLAGPNVAAVLVIVPVALNDAILSTGLAHGVYLLELGFVLPIAAVASSATRRFVREAEEHAALRAGLEQAVEERTRRLGRTQAALHEAERLAALGQIAAGLAHEVNNPAAAISVNLRFIQDTADPGPNRDEIRLAAREGMQAVSRIVALVRRLAEAGRLAGKAEEDAHCGLGEPVARALEDAGDRFPGGRVSFRAAPLAGLRVAATENDVHHAVLALLVNGAEAIPPGRAGTVSLWVFAAGGQVEIRVEDDGVGLADEAAARAFEPFFSTKPPGEGPGLGLTLAQAFARRHGGDVRLERRAQGGTRAVLVLPAAQGAAPARPGRAAA